MNLDRKISRVLAMFERNLVVVEPRFGTMLCHANINSCLTECGSDSGLVYDVVYKRRTVKRAKVFLCVLGPVLESSFPRSFELWLLISLAMLLIQL